MAIGVRPLQRGDLDQVAGMIRALAAHHGDDARVTAATLERDALGDDPWVRLYVADTAADAGAGLAGYMALKRLAWLHCGDRGMEIYHLFVQAGWRGQGVGRSLIRAAQDLARAEGCVELKVGTHPANQMAMDYYRALGFEPQENVGARFRFVL